MWFICSYKLFQCFLEILLNIPAVSKLDEIFRISVLIWPCNCNLWRIPWANERWSRKSRNFHKVSSYWFRWNMASIPNLFFNFTVTVPLLCTTCERSLQLFSILSIGTLQILPLILQTCPFNYLFKQYLLGYKNSL